MPPLLAAKALALAVLALPVLSARAADATAAGTALFETRIRPVLVRSCYECHSAESGKAKGGLLLDSKHGITTGGENGPAVIPGDPSASLLLQAITHQHPDLEMPPNKPKLPDRTAADFRKWIELGAPDPRAPTSVAAPKPLDLAAAKNFWAYRKPEVRPPPPPNAPGAPATGWARTWIDEFILAELRRHDLRPSPDADPVTLLRRVHFDLAGTPPTPEDVAAFVAASAAEPDAALAKVVDRLLAEPSFGVRWARHWLDVARFAESNGRESNLAFPHAWRYRDYVIDSVTHDLPYDRFIIEQVAGDLLPAQNPAERARLLIATGFLALGAKGLNETNRAQYLADVADEQVDTVTRAVIGSSIACARCHDHKTDPFSMEDYYALAGIFTSTQTCYGTWIDSENNNGSDLIRLPDLPGQVVPNRSISAGRVAHLKADLAKLDREEREQNEMALQARREGRDISGQAYEMLRNSIRIYWSRGGIQGQLQTVDTQGRALPLCMGVREAPTVRDAPVLERGEIKHPGPVVPRGFPRVLSVAGQCSPGPAQSGRLELARWLTSPEHPLTARVMANRVWHHLLGSGLVRTVDNFGANGERPSHPELLDRLAVRFVDSGWSVKSLVREVILSRAYRQASTHRPECFDKDPENRLLWRAQKRRLQAEVIRDSMLAVAGELDHARRPGSLVADLTGQSVSLVPFNTALPPDLDGMNKRSIYLPILRDRLPDVLELFDFAEPSLVTGSRDVTNVPPQALYLLNGPFVQARAEALARRALGHSHDPRAAVNHAFLLCFSRAPTPAEEELASTFLHRAGPGHGEKALAWFCQAVLAAAEFRISD